MIKLTCIKTYVNYFDIGEDYILLTRRGGGFVEVLTKDGHAKDFNVSMLQGVVGYPILNEYFNLVPINQRRVLIEKQNNIYNIL